MALGKKIGIDLGTANILVAIRGQGVVLREPAVVALSQRDNAVVAVGEDARAMMGRSPEGISIVRPMRDGVIADYVVVEAMLRYFLGRVTGRLNLVRPEVMISAPAGSTPSSSGPCATPPSRRARVAPRSSSRSRWRRRSAPACPSRRRAATSSSISAAAAPRRP